jgi:iron(III) transport system substrate-binding protein
VLELSAQDPSIGEKAANHFFAGGDPGSLINVAGVGVIGEATDESLELVRFLLSGDGTQYFSKETYEYPLVETVKPDPRLPPLESIEQPDIDLSDLDDLNGTLDLLREVGLL